MKMVLMTLALISLWCVLRAIRPPFDSNEVLDGTGTMRVLVDADTGCQYLQLRNGRDKNVIIRRMTQDGTQFCAPVGPTVPTAK